MLYRGRTESLMMHKSLTMRLGWETFQAEETVLIGVQRHGTAEHDWEIINN